MRSFLFTLSIILFLLFFPTLLAFIVLWWKKRKARIAAGENYKSDPQYIKISRTKRIVGAVCIASMFLSLFIYPEPTPEEKAQWAAEEQAKAEKEAAEKRAKEEETMNQRIASLSDEEKGIYEPKLQEYMQNNDEFSAKSKALNDVDVYLKQKEEAESKAKEEAAEAEKKAQEAAEQLAKEEERKKENRKDLEALEKAGKIQYIDLGNGMFDVVITERATLKHDTGDIDKLLNYAIQDEHERNAISTAKQCMKLVQTVKKAGINVNNFTINLTGETVDVDGYKSIGNIVICEISGNKAFRNDDPYSFYNSTDRYWMINGL